MKIVKQVLCVLLMSVILLTDFIGSIFAGGVPTDRHITVRHVFTEQMESGKGTERYAAECAKILGACESMYIKNLEECSYVSRPIRENSVPTAADGLINPNDSIKLYAFRDKVSFGFSVTDEWDNDFLIRVFDDSGKLVGTFNGSEVSYLNDDKGFDLYPSREARNYYVEFSYDQTIRKQMYGSLNMRPDAAFGLSIGLPIPHLPSPSITIPEGSKKPSKSSSKSSSGRSSSKSKAQAENRLYCYVLFSISTFEPDILPEEIKEFEGIIQPYMKEHNKSSYSDIYSNEFYMIADAARAYFWERQIHFMNVSDWRATFARMSISDINKQSMNYLTKHKISSVESMTDAQIIALRASMIEGTFAGIPEYSRLVRDYKNKHGIKSYNGMTINQLNRMDHAIAKQASALSEKYRKQQTQPKSSSGKAKSTKKKKSR